MSTGADLPTLVESLAAIGAARGSNGIGGAARRLSGIMLAAGGRFLLRTWIMRRVHPGGPGPIAAAYRQWHALHGVPLTARYIGPMRSSPTSTEYGAGDAVQALWGAPGSGAAGGSWTRDYLERSGSAGPRTPSRSDLTTAWLDRVPARRSG